jgi:hypothetical protein
MDSPSHGSYPMKPIDVCFRMIRWSVIAVLLVFACCLFGPTLAAFGSYMIRPHQIAFDGVSVRVPPDWEIVVRKSHFALIEKRQYMLWSSETWGDSLYISSHGSKPPAQFANASEQDFRSTHSQENLVPIQLNSRLPNCLRTTNTPVEGWSTVGCWDAEHGVAVEFAGSDANLAEVGTLFQ